MTDRTPHPRPPTATDIREAATKHYMDLSDEEVDLFESMLPHVLASYERIDQLSAGQDDPGRQYADRDPGSRPGRDDDPLNAIVRTCEVRGASEGPLEGYRIGVKDNVAVAGIEMTCGSSLLWGHVPQRDATVVTALLDAGGTITAKTNMSAMAYTGSGELTATGDMLNPRDPNYLAGGSSGGSAAAVVDGTVDLALGTDQAGSVRIPAAWCGCVGFKPTHGRVPYTGIVGLGPTFDHVGPLARSVADCALAMDAIAVEDPLDPRQRPSPGGDFTSTLSHDLDDVSVGPLQEGFDDAEVSKTVRDALATVADADVTDVSVPLHDDGQAIYSGVANEAVTALMRDEGVGHYLDGHYDVQLAAALGRARRTSADDLPITLKLILVAGQYMAEEYFGTYHAKAQNLSRRLAGAYDDALDEVDVLAMPTTRGSALEVADDLTPRDAIVRSASMIANTAPFNCTGHPAISVPCGTVDGLPAGLMLVGERGDDETVLSVAHAVEAALDDEG